MTANNFIREFAIKTFNELENANPDLFKRVIQYSGLTEEDFLKELEEDNYQVAWFLGEFCNDILNKYFVETIREDENGWEKVYLIEDKYLVEKLTFSQDCYEVLDWRFVEKKTKMIEVTEWTEI